MWTEPEGKKLRFRLDGTVATALVFRVRYSAFHTVRVHGRCVLTVYIRNALRLCAVDTGECATTVRVSRGGAMHARVHALYISHDLRQLITSRHYPYDDAMAV